MPVRLKVAMIGCGKLGLPCAEVMSQIHDVVGYDPCPSNLASIPMCHSLEETVCDRDLIFVAVPTPHSPDYDGSLPISDLPPRDFDYHIVEDVLSKLNQLVTKDQLIVLISTVLPGTVRSRLSPLITNARLIYNPYLIAMGTVKHDMTNPECIIIGTKNGCVDGDAKLLTDFYRPLMDNDPPINIGTWDEAEAIKIFYNTFISMKISMVNMIMDVAEANGHINVDVVTDALKRATHRITGPRYMTAGMGDAGACHPRDNIALRWLANKLDIGYDLFAAIMESRDAQAKNLAKKLVELSLLHGGLPIVIHGKSYKPNVPYTDGSYSLLVGHFIQEFGHRVYYADPLTGDVFDERPAVILLAHNPGVTYSIDNGGHTWYFAPARGSIILDPWRTIHKVSGCTVFPYGSPKLNL